MQYEAKTAAEYLDALDTDWRKEKLQELRTLIMTNDAFLVEGINHKMLSYADDKGIIFHLNAQKNYVSLYVGDANKVDKDGTLLKGIDVGKGCIRFKKTTVLAATQIDQFIAKTIKFWQEGKDIGC